MKYFLSKASMSNFSQPDIKMGKNVTPLSRNMEVSPLLVKELQPFPFQTATELSHDTSEF